MRPGESPLRRIAAGAAAALAAFAAVVWFGSAPPDLRSLNAGPVPAPWSAWQEMADQARAEEQPFRPRWVWVPLDSIALSMQAAAVAGEDIAFLSHEGIDWTAVREALEEWARGEGLRGASTITQQTAKNLFLSSDRSLFRKLAEARLARALEEELGKRRILEIYLNIVELGPGILGVEAAARHYWGIRASRLDLQQATALAAALPSPRRDNPATRTEAWSYRQEVILQRLARYDWLYDRLLGLHPPDTARRLAARWKARADTTAGRRDTLGRRAAETPDTTTAWMDTLTGGAADSCDSTAARVDTVTGGAADSPDTAAAWMDTVTGGAAETPDTTTARVDTVIEGAADSPDTTSPRIPPRITAGGAHTMGTGAASRRKGQGGERSGREGEGGRLTPAAGSAGYGRPGIHGSPRTSGPPRSAPG